MPSQQSGAARGPQHWLQQLRSMSRWSLALLAGAVLVAMVLVMVIAAAFAYTKLPPIDALTDYRPKLPLRVFTADGVLIGEFGAEHRDFVRIADVPPVMKEAILAAEDERFYQHGGVDYRGVLRAALSNILHPSGHAQGASTITQQVAKNFFLSPERSLKRKLYEMLLAFKIESALSKDQILEAYINQIYLGEQAYGFASAEQMYFGKPLKDITVAEAAVLAGLPKGPSLNNPVVNPIRAKERQQYVLGRMLALGYLTQSQFEQAKAENPVVRDAGITFSVRADYVAEIARELTYDQFKEESYTRGLNVYTTIVSDHQRAAYQAVRSGLLDYERRQRYEGPEGYIELPPSTGDARSDARSDQLQEAVDDALSDVRDDDEILAAVVLDASPKVVRVVRGGDDAPIEISGDGLRAVAATISDKTPAARRIRRGAIIRIMRNAKGGWDIVQIPRVEAALVAGDSQTGAVHALVGGFDFAHNNFNHVTQAWRQPGSSFKPFLYSSALEKGFTPATLVDDAPIVIDAAQNGGTTWAPKNDDDKYGGPTTLRNALARSVNMVSIRILEAITPKYVQSYIPRFGLDAEKHPPYLTMALGAGSVTAWQMLGAYSVFANGGYKINPYLITRITDANGVEVAHAPAIRAADPANRVIDERNAFLMDSMLKGVVHFGTGAQAGAVLKRSDIAGKTGTTNDAVDAWFDGYANAGEVAITWVGFDQPRSLGSHEFAAGVALPIWISYMQSVLKGVPQVERAVPQGITNVGGEYYYSEFLPAQDPGQTAAHSESPVSNTN
jgi:penicillin-binding protein 1A